MTFTNVEFFIASLSNTDPRKPIEYGWFYWIREKGHKPSSYKIGPFDTKEEAVADYNRYQ